MSTHQTPAPMTEGEAGFGAGQTPASPTVPLGEAGPHFSDADAVGAPASGGWIPAPGRGAESARALGHEAGNETSGQPSAMRADTSPRWSPVDDDTSDLLSLVAGDKSGPWADEEWHRFTQALEAASDLDGRIDPNFLRPLLRGSVAPNRIGAFTNRAKAEGLIAWGGEWITSDDTEGRNSGKPARVYRWLGAAS